MFNFNIEVVPTIFVVAQLAYLTVRKTFDPAKAEIEAALAAGAPMSVKMGKGGDIPFRVFLNDSPGFPGAPSETAVFKTADGDSIYVASDLVASIPTDQIRELTGENGKFLFIKVGIQVVGGKVKLAKPFATSDFTEQDRKVLISMVKAADSRLAKKTDDKKVAATKKAIDEAPF